MVGTRIRISSTEQGKSCKPLQEILNEETKDNVISWDKCCIYRLPWCMKLEDNEKDYTPQLVSLGPYHHGKNNEQLEAMEYHKRRALRRLLNRTGQDIEIYLQTARELEHAARACYEEDLSEFSSTEFVDMLVLDGCFILETLLGYDLGFFDKLGYSKKDPVFSKTYMRDGILRDMIMLENQIPLFVLERLHGLKPDVQNLKNVVELAINILKPYWVTERSLEPEEFTSMKEHILSSSTNVGLRHCLDIFLQTLKFSPPPPPRCLALQETTKNGKEIDPKDQLIPSVTQLKEAGVKFKVVLNKRLPFWDIYFDKRVGTMEMPQIVINDKSESMFLNLMAFEQCHLSPNEAQITSYISLLDNLMNSAADVAQLIEDEILVHTLGSDEEVAEIFNRLAKGIYFSVEDGCYAGLYGEVNEYKNKRINQWRAKLMHDYFSSPWSIIALFGATLELVLSFVQTVKG